MAAKNPLGPVGDQLRANIRTIREAHGFTYQWMADRLAEIGRPIPTLGLSRIENGERRVDADDLVALAQVLQVAVPDILGLGCSTCFGRPPRGFTCDTCGASA